MFNSKYLEKTVRKTLKINGRELLKRDLRAITGIIINDTGAFEIPIVWYMDSSAYAMAQPNLVLSAAKLVKEKGWESDMLLFKNAKSFYCMIDIPLMGFIDKYTKLTDLQLMTVKTVTSWAFLRKMKSLHMVALYDCGPCGDEALSHLCSLYSAQSERIEAYKRENADCNPLDFLNLRHLDYIALTKMQVTDISPMAAIKDLSELDLSWNEISDVSALANTEVYCLSLRHNEIGDVASLNINDTYMLNLRWNNIKSIQRIISKTSSKQRVLSRLYVGFNDIPKDELQALERKRFLIDNDFYNTLLRDDELMDGIKIDRKDRWIVEKVTDRDGRQKHGYFYADITGALATDVRIAARAGIVLSKDVFGNDTRNCIRTSGVEKVKQDGDKLDIITMNSVYCLRKLSDKTTKEQ